MTSRRRSTASGRVALADAKQFHPGPTGFFNLRGKSYAADYNEVKAVGSAAVRSAAPDSEESRIARYWPGGGANLNGFARIIVADRDLDMWQTARLFALMNIAVNDGLVVTFKTKYLHNFWRPVTAIRWADDGNRETESDPTWTSYITTPPYPDFTCGLPSTIGSATEILRDFLGTDDVSFTVTATGLPPSVTRSFTRSRVACSSRGLFVATAPTRNIAALSVSSINIVRLLRHLLTMRRPVGLR